MRLNHSGRRTHGLTAVLVLVLGLCWSHGALAQDDGEMTFDVEEVEEVKDAAPVGKFLAEGEKYYDKKEYRQASIMFHKAKMETDASADKFRPKAQYELAKSLYRLEVYQGAMEQFVEIVEEGEGHPYYEATLSWLMLLSRKLPGAPDLLSHIGKYAPLYPERVPEKFRDELAYLLGRHFYKEADMEQALQFFKRVSNSSEFFAEARYLEGITHVRLYQAKPAVNSFKQVLGWVATQDLDEPEVKKLEQLSLLAMARTFYSVGQYEKAIKYYDFVGQDSPYWLDALFEESWTYFQLDRYNKALGNLHTLNAPFFDDEYFPESMILTAVVFFTNCQYERVRSIIQEDFELIYPPLRDQLQEILDQYQDPVEFYDFLNQINEGEGEFDPRLNQILDAALTDQTLKRTLSYVAELNKELELVEASDPSWKDSELGFELLQRLSEAQVFALQDAGKLSRSRFERVVSELNDLIKQGKKILIETAKAESDALDQRVKDEQFVGKDPTAMKKGVDVDDEHVYWSFKGEYWRDELGYYLYDIKSECGR